MGFRDYQITKAVISINMHISEWNTVFIYTHAAYDKVNAAPHKRTSACALTLGCNNKHLGTQHVPTISRFVMRSVL